jgi:hypothetical protein
MAATKQCVCFLITALQKQVASIQTLYWHKQTGPVGGAVSRLMHGYEFNNFYHNLACACVPAGVEVWLSAQAHQGIKVDIPPLAGAILNGPAVDHRHTITVSVERVI